MHIFETEEKPQINNRSSYLKNLGREKQNKHEASRKKKKRKELCEIERGKEQGKSIEERPGSSKTSNKLNF